MYESVQSMNKSESCFGTINAMLLLLFLTGGVTMLLLGVDMAWLPVSPGNTALWTMGIILLADVAMCMTPLSLTIQPLLMLALGSTACLEAQEILRGTGEGSTAMRLMLLLFLVSSGFILGGRGLFNALLLIRAIRGDPCVLGRSVKRTCVPVIFGIAVLFLLCRMLRSP